MTTWVLNWRKLLESESVFNCCIIYSAKNQVKSLQMHCPDASLPISKYDIILTLKCVHHKLVGLNNSNYCLTVLEARHPRLRCRQGWFFRLTIGKVFSLTLLILGSFLKIFGVLWNKIHLLRSLFLCSHGIFPVFISASKFMLFIWIAIILS